jgi:hypothetical protein
MVRPSSFAVLRLRTSSNCMGCSTGSGGRRGALEALVHIRGSAPNEILEMCAIGDEPTIACVHSAGVQAWQTALSGQSDDRTSVQGEQRVLLHDERAHVGRDHASEGALQFGPLAHLEEMQCHPQRPGSRLHLVQLWLVARPRRIGEIAHPREPWRGLFEQLQPLGPQLAVDRGQAGKGAARPGEALRALATLLQVTNSPRRITMSHSSGVTGCTERRLPR